MICPQPRMGSVNAGHTKGNGGADASRRFASLFNRNAKGRGFKYASGGQGASVPERAMGGRRDGPADDAGGGRFFAGIGIAAAAADRHRHGGNRACARLAGKCRPVAACRHHRRRRDAGSAAGVSSAFGGGCLLLPADAGTGTRPGRRPAPSGRCGIRAA